MFSAPECAIPNAGADANFSPCAPTNFNEIQRMPSSSIAEINPKSTIRSTVGHVVGGTGNLPFENNASTPVVLR
jgi:hypothetical protein